MHKLIYAFLLSLILASCKKDFLEIVPKGSLIPQKIADYNLLMNSIRFYEYNNGLPALVMGDDVAAEEAVFQNQPARIRHAFRWDNVLYDVSDYAFEFSNYVNNLYACNKIIREVMNATDGTDQQKRSLRAEALAMRAWLNFQLINLYAKPYTPGTAAADPGFPIILTADVSTDHFDRGTVQAMYDQIIGDFNTAIPDLPVKNTIATRMSRAAAKGLLGKVYLFMGKNSDALTQFNGAFADITASPGSPVLYDYNVTFAPGGSFLPIGFFGPRYPGNNINDFTECILAISSNGGSYNGNGFGNGGLVLDDSAAALYDSSDFRLNFYSNKYADGTPIPGGRLRKYAVQNVKIGLQLSDLYLLRAETKARLNDLSGAKSDVELLRRNRMPPADAGVPASVASDPTAMIRFIIDERTREFAGEGYRWSDMRRLSIDPAFSGTSYKHVLHTISGIDSIYTLRPERLTLQFPPFVMTANPTMSNNP